MSNEEILAAIEKGNFIVGKNNVADILNLFPFSQEAIDAIQELKEKYPEQWEKLKEEKLYENNQNIW